jgi:sugar lactone lactonase YvrE
MAKGKGGFIGQDGLNAPDAPTGVSGTAGDTQVEVSWTAPSDVGGSAITGYNVQAADGSGTIFPSYDIENASYDSKSFAVSSQDTFPTGVAFNPSGTKMYIVGNGNDRIYEYDLSTANDVSTATYNSVSFDNSSQATAATGMVFNNDGTKMYIVSGGLSRYVYQYSLSTAYDVSSASYDSVSLNVGTESTDPTDLRFNNDGSKLFVLQAASADSVFQYSLTSNFDLSTASYDSVSFSVGSQDSTPTSLSFNSDGSKMFIIGTATDKTYQYSLSTNFDISTASYDNIFFDQSVPSSEGQPRGLAFSDYGDKLYVVGYDQDTVYQFSTGTAAGDYPTASPVTVTGLTNGTSYTFNVWAINAFGWSSPSDASDAVSPAAPRGVFALGYSGGYVNTIDYASLSSAGNTSDFGDLTVAGDHGGAVASKTRAVFGYRRNDGGTQDVMDYITIASTGNATDFGDAYSAAKQRYAAVSSETRGLWAGGDDGSETSNVHYITIATTGNAANFKDLTASKQDMGGLSSPTRAIVGGGYTGSGTNVIEYSNFATTGSWADFGDLTETRRPSGASNNTRGLFIGGYSDTLGNYRNTIDYITIASTGNATDFGDTSTGTTRASATSSPTLAVFNVNNDGTATNVLEQVTISTAANSTDFGDLTAVSGNGYATSSAHGGIA